MKIILAVLLVLLLSGSESKRVETFSCYIYKVLKWESVVDGLTIDNDSYLDKVAGVIDGDGCGGLHVYLSTLGIISAKEERQGRYDQPTIDIRGGKCDPGFGINVYSPEPDQLLVLGSGGNGWLFETTELPSLAVDGAVVIIDVEEMNTRRLSKDDVARLGLVAKAKLDCEPCRGLPPCCDGTDPVPYFPTQAFNFAFK